MTSLMIEIPSAQRVRTTRDALTLELSDGREMSVPLAWYPRLLHATAAERAHCRLMADGRGIHWSALDEDISVEDLLVGRPSAESPKSLAKWLAKREKKRK